MTTPVATGSGIERAHECRASSVLPRVWRAGGRWASRGTEVHAYLERIANGMPPAESLLLTSEEHRPAAEGVDLPALAEDLRLTAEVAFAYNPFTDTARELGRSLERDYSSVTEDEIPLTIDVAGLAAGVGIVRDYKTGFTRLARTRGNWQMRGAAIAVARTFDLDQVDAQLIYLREGRPVWRDRATFNAFELAGIAAELRTMIERVRADRAAFADGHRIEPTQGSWCNYCPSWSSCPAQAALVRWALTGEGDGLRPIEAGDLASALERVKLGKKALDKIEQQILSSVESVDPLLVEVGADGTETWLGKHSKPGNERLDPSITVEVAADVLAIPADRRAAFAGELLSVSKKALNQAVLDRVARGDGQRTVDAILTAVRARGGATRPTSESVGLFTRRLELPVGSGT